MFISDKYMSILDKKYSEIKEEKNINHSHIYIYTQIYTHIYIYNTVERVNLNCIALFSGIFIKLGSNVLKLQ